jgi:hypothetical protein
MSTSDYKNLKRCFGIKHENHLLFGETNFDANGKYYARRKGQDIPIGDGVIKIERL